MKRRHLLSGVFFAVAAVSMPSYAISQEFPSQVVRLIVPQPPGGATDILGRALASKLAEKWSQPVIVENIVGASGMVGTQHIVTLPPDGYTLLFTYEGSQAINPHVLAAQDFDALNDFTPVATVARAGFMFVVNSGLPVETFEQFVELAKDEDNVLTYGSAGAGSANHLIAEMIKDVAGVQVDHVPYRVAPQAVADVVGGHIDSAVASIPSVLGQLGSGELKALAVTSAQRSSAAPDIPTIAESGYPDFDVTPWWGVLGPKGMDEALVTQIAANVNEILEDEDMRATLQTQGAEPFASSPEEFRDLLAADLEKWGSIVSQIDLEP